MAILRPEFGAFDAAETAAVLAIVDGDGGVAAGGG